MPTPCVMVYVYIYILYITSTHTISYKHLYNYQYAICGESVHIFSFNPQHLYSMPGAGVVECGSAHLCFKV